MFVLFEKEYLAEGFPEFAVDVHNVTYFAKKDTDAIHMLTEDKEERVVTFKDEASRDKYWGYIMARVGVTEPACLSELLHTLKNHPDMVRVTKLEPVKTKNPAKKKAAKKKVAKKPLVIQPAKKKAVKKK